MPTDSPETASRADDLLAGPRGRRVLLEFLTGAEQPTGADGGFPLSRAVGTVADDLDPQRDRRARYVRIVSDGAAGDDGDSDDATSAAPETSESSGTPDTPEAVARIIADALAADAVEDKVGAAGTGWLRATAAGWLANLS